MSDVGNYTLRRTCPTILAALTDFVCRYKGHDVGYTYLNDKFPGGQQWTWTIYLGHHMRQILPAVPVAGAAVTLE